MTRLRIVNRTRDSVLGSRVSVADRWWQRIRGLLGRPAPAHGEGLLLSPCQAVHTHLLPYPLDIIFIHGSGCVVATYAPLAPGRRSGWHLRAKYALELPPGTIAATGTVPGDHIAWLASATGLVTSSHDNEEAARA